MDGREHGSSVGRVIFWAGSYLQVCSGYVVFSPLLSESLHGCWFSRRSINAVQTSQRSKPALSTKPALPEICG